MKFIQNKDNGNAEIKFSWKERLILFFRGSLHFDALNLKHFGNTLVKIVAEWQLNFNNETKNKLTKDTDSIQGK